MTEITYEPTPRGFRFKDEGGTGLTIFGEGIHRDRWGKQRAKVVIAQSGRVLDMDELDINDRATRNTLANSAFDQADPPLPPDDKKALRQLLLDFLDGLWDAQQRTSVGKVLKGNTEDSLPDMLIPGLVVCRGGHLLFAPPGAGKSWIGYIMQQALTHGLYVPFKVTRPAKTLLVNLERDEESVKRRYGRINLSLDLPRDAEFGVVGEKGETLAQVHDSIQMMVRDDGYEVVILDSLSRSGSSLVSDAEANATMDVLNGLGVTWIAIAHSPYGDNSKTFGSRMFQAACDVEIRLDSQTLARHLKAVRLRPVKANDIPPYTYTLGQEFHLDYGLSRVWLADDRDFPSRGCDALTQKGENCRRFTWGGVDLVNGTYCSMHRRERMDDD